MELTEGVGLTHPMVAEGGSEGGEVGGSQQRGVDQHRLHSIAGGRVAALGVHHCRHTDTHSQTLR